METATSSPARDGSDKHIPRFFMPPVTLLNSTGSWNDVVGIVGEKFRELGDVFQMTGIPLTYNVIWFRHPDHIREIFNHETIGQYKAHQEVMDEKIRLVMGKGGFIHHGGPEWERSRRMVDPAFYREAMLRYAKNVSPLCDELLQRWQTFINEGTRIDLNWELRRFILDLGFKTFFSVDLGDKLEEVHEASLFANHMFDYKPPLMVPTPTNQKYRKAAAWLQQLVMDIIAERRRNPLDRNDVLKVLLETRDRETGAHFTDEEIRDEIFSIYFGAYVMGTAMAWTFYALAKHPHWRRELENEVDSFFQGREPVAADLSKVRVPLQIFCEATRMYPGAWLVTRYAPRPTEVAGYRIPGNTILMLPPYFVHRHPDFWEDPEGFDPGRFAPEKRSKMHRYAHIPFSGGPRMCLGHQMAQIIIQLTLIKLAQKVELVYTPQSPMEPIPNFSFELEPKNPFLFQIRRRSPLSS